MSGIPVVISENGLGLPVKQVDDGAAVMTLADNGLGIPIVLSDRGAPFVIQGSVPVDQPRLDFSKPSNSMYLPIFMRVF